MGSDNELLIRLGVDASGANKQLKAIQQELKELNKQIKIVDDSTDDYNKSSEGLTKQLNLQTKAAEAYTEKLKIQQKQINDYKNELKKKQQYLDELNQAEVKNRDEIRKTEQAIANYTQKIAKAETEMATTTFQLESMNRKLSETQKTLNGLKWEKMSKGLKTVSDGFKKASDVSDNLANKLAPLSATITGAFVASAKTAMDFETAITQVAVTSQATEKELQLLKESALKLGEELPISASQAAEGLNYLALAGYSIEEQLTAIEPIAKASVAWNQDLAMVSDLATDSLSAMGLSAADLAHYMDIASTAQSNANTTAIQMMEAYVETGGVLKTLNIPIEESASFLGIMANRGIKAGEAGRALNAVLINLTAGTSKVEDALEELGIATFDSEGNFRGLETILTELNVALADCTEEQKNNYLAAIGGKLHVADLNALLAGLGDEYFELKGDIEGSTGALDEMTETMSNTTAMKIEELKGKLETLAITIGEKIFPTIERFADVLIGVIEWFNGLSEATQNSILQFGFFVAIASPVLKGFSTITGGASTLFDMLSKITHLIGAKGGLTGLFGNLTTTGTGTATTLGTLATKGGSLLGVFTNLGSTLTGGAVAGGAATLTGIAVAIGGIIAAGLGIKTVADLFAELGIDSQLAEEGIYSTAEASVVLQEALKKMDGSYESTKDAIVTFSDIALSTWTEMIHNQVAISDEGYSTITKTLGETHNAIIGEMEQRKIEVPALARAMYADELAEARLKGDEEVRIVEEKIAEKEQLLFDSIEREISAENGRYEQLLEDAQNATDKRYATDENFREQSSQRWEDYYQHANRIFGTGEAINIEEVQASRTALSTLIQDFCNNSTQQTQMMYNEIHDKISKGCQDEIALLDASHQAKLDRINGYSEEEVRMTGLTREQLLAIEEQSYQIEYDSINAHYDALETMLENSGQQMAMIERAQQALKMQVLNEGLSLAEVEYETFNARVAELVQQGGMTETQITQQVMNEIKAYRETGYFDMENRVRAHNTAMGLAAEEGGVQLKDATHRGIGGAITTIEEADFSTPMANNMQEAKTAIETTDLTTSSQIAFGQVVTGAETAMAEIPNVAMVGLGAGALTIQAFDFLTPALAAFGLIPQATVEKMSEANTNVSTGLDTMSGTINSWDTASAMSMPSSAFIESLNTLMSDSNTSTQDGLEQMNTSIQNAPFGESMDQQGSEVMNSLTNSFTNLNEITSNGLDLMNTSIRNAPFQETFTSQGSKMTSAQQATMSKLQSVTQTGMSKLLGIVQQTWGSIVSWWNSQNLNDKNVNVNVRTNYTSTGSPTTYSAGVGVGQYSLRSDDSSFFNGYNPIGYEIRDYNVRVPSLFDDFNGVDVPYVNVLNRRESGTTYDIDGINKRLDHLINALERQSNGNTNINVEEMNIRNDQDIRNLARELDALRKIQSMGRGGM